MVDRVTWPATRVPTRLGVSAPTGVLLRHAPPKPLGGGSDPGDFYFHEKIPETSFDNSQPRSNMDLQKAVAYVRVSTEDQNLGPEAQKYAIEQYASRQGLTICSTWFDKVSGSSPLDERPGLGAAFRALRENGAGTLIIAKRDRLARDVYLALLFERELRTCGARIVTADGINSEDTPEGRLLRGMLDLFSEHERQMIRMRTKAAMAAKKAKGEPVGNPPYGYRFVDHKLSQVPEEMAIVARVIALHKQGMSIRQVTRAMRTSNYRARNGRALSFSLVRGVIQRGKKGAAGGG